MENEMTSEAISYNCHWCGSLFSRKLDADECAYRHAKENYANTLLESGMELNYINRQCGFNWELTEEQNRVTKRNCFVVSWWQCSNEPAYQIVAINHMGYLKLWGKGGWTGYYGDYVPLKALHSPLPESKLFVYKNKD